MTCRDELIATMGLGAGAGPLMPAYARRACPRARLNPAKFTTRRASGHAHLVTFISHTLLPPNSSAKTPANFADTSRYFAR